AFSGRPGSAAGSWAKKLPLNTNFRFPGGSSRLGDERKVYRGNLASVRGQRDPRDLEVAGPVVEAGQSDSLHVGLPQNELLGLVEEGNGGVFGEQLLGLSVLDGPPGGVGLAVGIVDEPVERGLRVVAPLLSPAR